jgi:hypothetical protein
MCVTGCEEAARIKKARILLHSDQQVRQRLAKAPADEMSRADPEERIADSSTRAQAQRRLRMFDRGVGVTAPKSDIGANMPAVRNWG